MSPTDVNEEDGFSILYSKQDELFKEDENKAALETYDKFERYSRPSKMTIADYLIEFDKMTGSGSIILCNFNCVVILSNSMILSLISQFFYRLVC